MAGARMRRVNEAVREVVSAHIAEDVADPRIGFVTVTGVETSADLRSARVYVSGLGSARGYLQQRVGEELRMKRTPTLEFVHDDSIQHGMRISRLLADLSDSSGERPA